MRPNIDRECRGLTRARKSFATPILVTAALVLALPGCGSGSSGSSALTITPSTVSVSATDIEPAPTAAFQVNVLGLNTSQVVYLTATSTHNGIIQVTDSGGGFLPATYSIQFNSPASLGVGNYDDTVTIAACYDDPCTEPVSGTPQQVQVHYTVSKSIIAITNLSPASVVAGSPGFNLVVTGTDFTPNSTILWNGATVLTTFDSATQLTSQVPADAVAVAKNVQLSVTDPKYGTSNAVTFVVGDTTTHHLALTSVAPGHVTVGGPAFTLTALGTGFSTASTVKWNGVALTTTYVSQRELLAQVPAADINATGSASILVVDPTNSPSQTGTESVSIVPASIDSVGFGMNPAHTGAVTFKSVIFPPSSTWSVDVGGTPSYAIIADGLVIVTVELNGGTSELLALDQSTGKTVWSDAMSGGSYAAYDNGRIFAFNVPFNTPPVTMKAFDAATGTLEWSTDLATGDTNYSFTAPPTATDGTVYIDGFHSGGILDALDEVTGTLLWTKNVVAGDNSTPAVTADGLYLSYPCGTYDYRPATGELIWNDDNGCFGGDGTPAIVANQLLYSLDGFSSEGHVLDPETGASLGTYMSNWSPAFTTSMGYYLQQDRTLQGIRLSDNTVQWTFTGDGNLAGSPIAVNQYVFVGSNYGQLYALDSATGFQVWNVSVPDPNLQTFTGLVAGDGLLVVSCGTTVTAYTLSTNP